ncbi:hypothetical protein LCGC14_2439060 [marine sediment metagenome]|uniref:Uncharacterized protein n=1 Tax=marine sediment metagenome TaxID=412755 RepID=A0A0F9EDH2_9ZZZZ
MTTKRQCGIVDLATGEICEELLHFNWPFCLEHGKEYKTYATGCEKMYVVALQAGEWAKWRKTGEVRT